MNQELSMSPNLLVAAPSKTGFRIYESRHCFLYKGERHSYGELHVSCGETEDTDTKQTGTEDTELCHQ